MSVFSITTCVGFSRRHLVIVAATLLRHWETLDGRTGLDEVEGG